MAARRAYGELARWLGEVPKDVLASRRREAALAFRHIGSRSRARPKHRNGWSPSTSSLHHGGTAPVRGQVAVHVDQAQRQAQM